MRQKILIGAVAAFVFSGPVKGEDEIDRFVSTRCDAAGNVESTEYRNCYTQAVELFDQPQSMSWEGNPSKAIVADDLDVNPNMGLEIPF